MDPLSICASAVSIIAVAGQLIGFGGTFIYATGRVDDNVRQFYDTISALSAVVGQVEDVFSKRSKPYSFERRHWLAIKKVLNSCKYSVDQLEKALPEKPMEENSRVLEKVCKQWSRKLRENIISDLVSHISSYTTCLSISLNALGVVHQWKTQELILESTKELSNQIRQAQDIFQRQQNNLGISNAVTEDRSSTLWSIENKTAEKNITEWIESTKDLPGALETSNPEQENVVEVILASPTEEDDIPDDESNYDPGFEIDDILEGEYFETQVETFRRNIEHFVKYQYFDEAEQHQRDLMVLLEKQAKRSGKSNEDRNQQEDLLATILYNKGTRKGLDEAKYIVQKLLKAEKDETQKVRLCHFLALIYLKQGRCFKARSFTTHAFNRREKLGHISLNDARESLLLLQQINQTMGDYTSAKANQMALDALDKKYGSSPTSKRNGSIASAYASATAVGDLNSSPDGNHVMFDWLQRRGFSTSREDGSTGSPFDEPHPETKKRPLQMAIDEDDDECVEIIRELLEHGVSLTNVDEDGATPLIQAATTHHSEVVKTIIAHGEKNNIDFDINAADVDENNALQALQSRERGIKAARALLSANPPIDINHKNKFGQTALHKIAEFGNVHMLEMLLEYKTILNLDIEDLGCNSACHVAVKNKQEQVLHLLVEAGAYTLENSKGVDIETAIRDSPYEFRRSSKKLVKAVKEKQRSEEAKPQRDESADMDKRGASRSAANSVSTTTTVNVDGNKRPSLDSDFK